MRGIPRVFAALVALFAVAVLAACGGPELTKTADGRTALRVGIIPTIDAAPLYLGVSEGIFAKHGLDVTVHVADSGAALIPATVKQENQIGYANVISDFQAAEQGLDIKLVHNCCGSGADPAKDVSQVLVKPDGPIRTVGDLAHANIAVNSLHNIGEVSIKMALEKRGVDVSGIQFTPMPFSDMNDALKRGDVDAIWQVEPNVQAALAAGFTPLISNFVEARPEATLGYYLTSGAFAKQNPQVVQAFSDAMDEANRFATEHPDKAREAVVTNLRFNPEIVSTANLPTYPQGLDRASAAEYATYAVKYGAIEKAPDLDGLFWSGPAN
ncbi:ABC transporter substrate-binding protein [Saccharopolyspora sp. 5N102]|uniref:ABC transporter substrate-binding protein n=1 Tax=Saccharopolyspora sp. 5N102 TaxID=3375155 RepID=UPI0037BBC475